MKILIPTCQSGSTVAPLIAEIHRNTPGADTFASCLDASASVNRNRCLDEIQPGDIAIMLDDDISGFYPAWHWHLISGMTSPAVVMVSARLLKPNGKFGQTSSDCYDPEPEEIPVSMLPTAAIAFRYTGLRFDEAYAGSGWEDTDYVRQIKAADPSAVLIQSNRCRLVHRNERKSQGGETWEKNKAYFRQKWGA